jgi:hypothetical protein
MSVDRVWQRVRVQLFPEPDRELRELLTWHESVVVIGEHASQDRAEPRLGGIGSPTPGPDTERE